MLSHSLTADERICFVCCSLQRTHGHRAQLQHKRVKLTSCTTQSMLGNFVKLAVKQDKFLPNLGDNCVLLGNLLSVVAVVIHVLLV